jgi:hypothetical protein
MTAMLEDGSRARRRIDVEVVKGRPPKTIFVGADDARMCRYCLADWTRAAVRDTHVLM